MLYQFICQLFEFGVGQFQYQVFGYIVYSCNIRQVNFCFGRRRKFNFCFFCCIFQVLQGYRVFLQVYVFLFFERSCQVINNYVVEVVVIEVCIIIGRFYFENVFVQFQDGNIEGIIIEVVYSNCGILIVFVQAIGQCSCSRFVNDMVNFKIGDFICFFGCLMLRVIEVGRNCYNCFCYFIVQKVFSYFFYFLKYYC